MSFEPGRIYHEMMQIYSDNYSEENKVIICNSGSSRSSKTWDTFHWIYTFCDHNRNQNQEIYFLRDKLVDCRDFTFNEFEKCMKEIGGWDESKSRTSPKPCYTLFGNQIYGRGLDEDKEAPPSDIIFINEGLEINAKKKIKGWRMRCRKALIIDWNPKYTDHWCFDLEGQPNTFFTHSTYKDNKHLEGSVVDEIEQYSPWHLDDIYYPNGEPMPDKLRRPHQANIKNGTADKYYWLVYGEGRKSAQEGAIFKNVRYIDEWPEDIAPVHGMDFGFTVDPTALVKLGESSKEIYIELLLYEPTPTSEDIYDYCNARKISRGIPCQADSSDKYTAELKGSVEMVKELKGKGWAIQKVRKTKTIMIWVQKMQKKRINIINNDLTRYAKKEQENYVFKEMNGILVNQPEDKFNHMWDASRYAYMGLHQSSGGMW